MTDQKKKGLVQRGLECLNQNGWKYSVETIDRLLMERHMAKKARRAKKKVHLKGPDKRTRTDNEKFADGSVGDGEE